MNNETKNTNALSSMWSRTQYSNLEETSSPAALRVNVIFTDPTGTIAALKMAEKLASDMEASVKVIVAQAVSYNFDLEHPQVDIDFLRRTALDIALEQIHDANESTVQVCICRDKLKALLRILTPNSLVVIGAKKRWWPTEESRLAKALRREGHEVVFADC